MGPRIEILKNNPSLIKGPSGVRRFLDVVEHEYYCKASAERNYIEKRVKTVPVKCPSAGEATFLDPFPCVEVTGRGMLLPDG